MSLPGRPPAIDAELIRQLHDRIRALETATTLRLGQGWVLGADPNTGALMANRPGESVLLSGPVIEGEVVNATASTDVATVHEQLVMEERGQNDIITKIGTALTGIVDAGLSLINVWSNGTAKVANVINDFINFGASIFNAIFGAGASTATSIEQAAAEAQEAVTNIHGRVTALEGGGVMTTYTISGTWTNPAPTEHRLITVIAVGGGDGGAKGSTGIQDTAKGGRNGGYVSRQLYTDELPATVAMVIGAPGAGNTSGGLGGSGGTTTFGTFVVSTKGLGAVYKDDGSYAVAIAPGDGGNGSRYDANGPMVPSQPGVSSAFAVGGTAGFGGFGNGGDGGTAPANVPSGGGGGGGGSVLTPATTGPGGLGGFPGGGGGGGAGFGTGFGNGASGASGCIYVIDPEG